MTSVSLLLTENGSPRERRRGRYLNYFNLLPQVLRHTCVSERSIQSLLPGRHYRGLHFTFYLWKLSQESSTRLDDDRFREHVSPTVVYKGGEGLHESQYMDLQLFPRLSFQTILPPLSKVGGAPFSSPCLSPPDPESLVAEYRRWCTGAPSGELSETRDELTGECTLRKDLVGGVVRDRGMGRNKGKERE